MILYSWVIFPTNKKKLALVSFTHTGNKSDLIVIILLVHFQLCVLLLERERERGINKS